MERLGSDADDATGAGVTPDQVRRCALSIVSVGGGGRGTTPGRRRRPYNGTVEVVEADQ